MQKGRPASRLSGDKDQMLKNDVPSTYAEGFSAGYEAGRRASLGEGTQQRTTGANGQRFSGGTAHQRSPSQGKKGFIGARHAPVKNFQHQPNNDTQQHFERRFSQGKTQNGGHLSHGFPTHKPLDESTIIRDDHMHNQEHEMNGQITDPQAEVQFNTRGHY